MRPRTELALFGGLLVVLIALVSAIGVKNRPRVYSDQRATTFSSEPRGARGLADALERLGVEVVRLRRSRVPPVPEGSEGRVTLAVLNPSIALSPAEVTALMGPDAPPVSLLLAGPRSAPLMRCLGLDTVRLAGPMAVRTPGGSRAEGVRVKLALRFTGERDVVDSSRASDTGPTRCRVPQVVAAETLLVSPDGRPAALRLRTTAPDRIATVVADPDLLRNRMLKETGVGPVVLGWLLPSRAVWFDEYHQGYRAGGSLGAATLEWTLRSSWGWLGWQLVLVGLIALAASGVRFGPPVPVPPPARRSSAEHVRALAAALQASGGHTVAIGLIVDGLRRRLSRAGSTRAGDWREWIRAWVDGARSRPVRSLADRLERLGRGRPDGRQVLEAANIVEDMWTELRS